MKKKRKIDIFKIQMKLMNQKIKEKGKEMFQIAQKKQKKEKMKEQKKDMICKIMII